MTRQRLPVGTPLLDGIFLVLKPVCLVALALAPSPAAPPSAAPLPRRGGRLLEARVVVLLGVAIENRSSDLRILDGRLRRQFLEDAGRAEPHVSNRVSRENSTYFT